MITKLLVNVNDVAGVPLKSTAVAPVKFLPTIVTVLPATLCLGATLVMTGAGKVKLNDEQTVPAGAVTQTGPVVPPTGGEVRITKLLSTVKVAGVPLNVTAVAPVKPLPTTVITLLYPGRPILGATLVILWFFIVVVVVLDFVVVVDVLVVVVVVVVVVAVVEVVVLVVVVVVTVLVSRVPSVL